jgi:hypothetical protein
VSPRATAIEHDHVGWSYTKLVVPSIGSTNQLYPVVPESAVHSSPTIASPGLGGAIELGDDVGRRRLGGADQPVAVGCRPPPA